MLCESGVQGSVCFTNVYLVALATSDDVHHIGGLAGEAISDMKGFLGACDGSGRVQVGAGFAVWIRAWKVTRGRRLGRR